jgi:hypothetical protein
VSDQNGVRNAACPLSTGGGAGAGTEPLYTTAPLQGCVAPQGAQGSGAHSRARRGGAGGRRAWNPVLVTVSASLSWSVPPVTQQSTLAFHGSSKKPCWFFLRRSDPTSSAPSTPPAPSFAPACCRKALGYVTNPHCYTMQVDRNLLLHSSRVRCAGGACTSHCGPAPWHSPVLGFFSTANPPRTSGSAASRLLQADAKWMLLQFPLSHKDMVLDV